MSDHPDYHQELMASKEGLLSLSRRLMDIRGKQGDTGPVGPIARRDGVVGVGGGSVLTETEKLDIESAAHILEKLANGEI